PSERPKAFVEFDKCTGCAVCAWLCPAKAIVFGNLRNGESDVSVVSKDPRAFHLQESLGTEPKVTYLREGA
ncbi:MAG: 4Fe-4S binding protein, partial [Elusimicrobiota bacterium]